MRHAPARPLADPPLFLATGACVAAQAIGVAAEDQAWPLQLGYAGLLMICAVATVRCAPASVPPAMELRWRIAAAGLAFWALNWVLITPPGELFETHPIIARLVPIVRYVCLIGAILPFAQRVETVSLRVLGLMQAGLFAVLLSLSAWPSLLTAMAAGRTNVSTVYIGFAYIGFGGLSLLAALGQALLPQPLRVLSRAIMLLALLSGAISIISVRLGDWYSISPSSPLWLLSDISFLAYLAVPLRGPVDAEPESPSAGIGMRHHLAPLLLTALSLLLSFGIGQVSPMIGIGTAIVGLLLYAARATILEERYRRAQDALVATEQSRSRAMIDTVHEVRGAVTSIVLDSETLRIAGSQPSVRQRTLESLQRGCTRVTALLNAVLDLEKAQSGLVPVTITGFDAGALVADAVDAVAGLAGSWGVEVRTLPARGRLLAEGDPTHLDRVLANLLHNALRFTPAGGSVTVRSDGRGDWVTITVADTGVGFAAPEGAFQRFGHVSKPLNGTRGSGLGLSIARALMDRMGGALVIDSAPGRGTTATVTLPAAISLAVEAERARGR